ncbi:lipoprotein-anchoring transpeptidase ErfK/SrfK [Agrobacterium vitis]|nr:lipoprotein-anchoring transpeptidase ErfK/SrfK [Agrobacterium vitis]MBE1436716.1 lipoprotein-anchoring transpeptidase ErfK/SrfK [Agrobacterium vitis]
MVRTRLLLSACLAVSLLPAVAMADDRYQARPPVIVSPDLAAPWLLQLGVKPRSPAAAPRSVVEQRAVVAPRQTYPAAPQPLRQQQPLQLRPAIEQAAMMPARKPSSIAPQFLPQVVHYQTGEKPGTLVIDTNNRFLYLVMDNGMARRYGVGVGKPGFEWAGEHRVTRKAEWPTWIPPQDMIAREAAKGHYLPARMEGGPENPLGARAMYLGSTLYRIHGTNAPWTIGYGVSSGCIRMRNEDVTDLYGRVPVGTKVIVM